MHVQVQAAELQRPQARGACQQVCVGTTSLYVVEGLSTASVSTHTEQIYMWSDHVVHCARWLTAGQM